MELAPGVVVAGKLRLTRPLGQGGMGVVWAARHLGLDTDVAVKFLRAERAAGSATLVARFEREARTTARITHPHVVRVMDFGAVDAALPYIVMELLEGYSLAELLERGGRLSLATARALVEQVAAALESAHAQGIVHRDVKPHNVFLTRGSDEHPLFVKVLDFGVAKMLTDAQVPGSSAELTETGTVIGSPPYMSPEQLEARRDVDLRADLWSLGVIVYECLTGTRPFQGTSFLSVGSAVLDGRYTPVTTLRPNLPVAFDHWFAKALCVDPEGRFQTARAMAEAFTALGAGEGESPSAEPPSGARGLPWPDATAPRGDEAWASATTELDVPVERPEAPSLPSPDPLIAEVTATHAPPLRVSPSPAQRGPGAWLRARAPWLGALGVAVATAVVLGAYRGARPTTCPAGMVRIEGATFPMGSLAEGETPSDETPLHQERVAAYCLDRTEVTVAAYEACASCERAPRTVEFEGLTPNGRVRESQFCNGPAPRPEGGPDPGEQPMNCVDWSQAKAYCEAQGKRLPTEPEWELAAAGAEGRPYPWGSAPPAKARLNACGAECGRMLGDRQRTGGRDVALVTMYADEDDAATTAVVGSRPEGQTPAGVLDLAGNVWEWTASAYCPYERPDCGDSRRVLRGGGWDTTEPRDVRASKRFPGAPTARGRSIGFRCAY